MKNPIFLIGYMGVGKTTIGKKLAQELDINFIDLDNYIEGRHCQSVSSIFASKGEDEFRRIEHNLLHEVALFENVVISTGGGVPCFFDNMEFMNNAGLTVYFNTSPSELVKRLDIPGSKRPILKERKGRELLEFISESLEKRNMFYMQAQIVLNVDGMDVVSILDRLVYLIKKA